MIYLILLILKSIFFFYKNVNWKSILELINIFMIKLIKLYGNGMKINIIGIYITMFYQKYPLNKTFMINNRKTIINNNILINIQKKIINGQCYDSLNPLNNHYQK